MFLGKVVTFASPSLRSLIACLLLLSGLALAGTNETRSHNETKSNKNADASDERSPRTNSRRVAEATPAKATRSGLRTPSASAIRSIKVAKDDKRGGMLMATIELDGQALYTHFTLPSPYRLVIDVQNVSTDIPSVIPVGASEVKRVRLGKMEDAVRVVFDAPKPQPYEITNEGNLIRVWFGEPKAAPTPTQNKPQSNSTPANAVKPSSIPVPTPPPARTEKPPAVTSKPLKMSENPPIATAKALQTSALETPKTTAPVAINQPKPVQLPASPKLVVKTIKPRTIASLASLRLTPPTNLLAKSYDVPPPARITASKRGEKIAPPTPIPSVVAKSSSSPVAVKADLPVPAPKVVPASVNRTETEKTTTVAPPLPTSEPIPAPRPREVAAPQTKSFNAGDYARPDFVGEPINLDLRSTQGKTVDIRDFLRFISDTYKVNFVIDQSVKDTPITVTLQNVPWNQAMEALLRANRLGVKVEGSILRVMSQETIALEDRIRQDQIKARQDATPLMTEMVRLNYARALTGAAAGSSGGGSSSMSGGGASAGGMSSGAGSTAGGSGLDSIIRTRLSQRGSIQADPRTNTLIITDLPENIAAIKEIIVKLDVPEPQVEIESRIVIANRNFARDLGVQLGGVAIDTGRGGAAAFSTYPNPIAPNVPVNPQSGINRGSANGSLFGTITDGLRAAGATSVLGLTLGITGTTQISAILSAAESKGNVKTISSPRITAQNNQTANIVNGVQIPVQTESNNTLTVTFVTAALRLEITPQINDNGNVLLKVVAENNSVNTAIATTAAPGINTQRAETTVLVPDGGTTIIGGINIDVESNAQQRTPGISRVPGLGELFKRRTVSRQTDEILFFITPRIYRPLSTPTVTTDQQK